jgi:UDP-glucose 4-epimerase
MIEQILKDHVKTTPNFSAICLRYFNPIGAHASGLIGHSPKDAPDTLLSTIVKVANGKLPHLCVFGNDYNSLDGTGVRDYIHVTDIARGHISALKKKYSGFTVFNLGTGRGTSVL